MSDRTWYKCPHCQKDIGVFKPGETDYEITVTQCFGCGKLWQFEDRKLTPYVKPMFIPHHQLPAAYWWRKAAECLPAKELPLPRETEALLPLRDALDNVRAQLVYLTDKVTQRQTKKVNVNGKPEF